MRHRLLVVAVLALSSVTVACAHGGTASRQRDPNLITQDEIARITATNAYDAVEMLRPSFLRQRGVPSTTSGMPDLAIVYLDG